MKVLNSILNLLDKQNSKSVYLSIFRVYISFHVMKKILFSLPYFNLIYGENSFAVSKSVDFYGLLQLDFFREYNFTLAYILLILSIMMMFGIGKNITIIFLFLGLEILQRMNPYFLNGGDNLLKFVMLYLCLCNCYGYFCFKNRAIKAGSIDNYLTNIGCYSIIIHLCLIYFISALHKIHSDVWFNGIATYYTLSIERFSGTDLNQYLTQNGYFVLISTYFTLFWELTFSFFVFKKDFKLFYIIGGIILHMFIYIFMMIHDFQILFISIYGFFYSDNELLYFKSKIKTYFIKIKYEKNSY